MFLPKLEPERPQVVETAFGLAFPPVWGLGVALHFGQHIARALICSITSYERNLRSW
jgi:hypothetical protein